MGIKRHSEPRPLQLSKRANVFYLEHARVVQQDDRIVYLTQDGGEFEQMFNIPERNTAFLLLGKGTSITDAAMRRMAASNVMVGFCGTGGSPLFSVCDIAFMTPQSEYRPTEYMQAWTNAARDLAQFSARFGTPCFCLSLILAQYMQSTRDFSPGLFIMLRVLDTAAPSTAVVCAMTASRKECIGITDTSA